jgi:hypothetical protein
MMNLLGGRGLIGAWSSESEGLQQPIKASQASDIDRRSAERHRRANGRIEHPGGEDDRHTRCSFNDDDLSSRSPFGIAAGPCDHATRASGNGPLHLG